nr:hypothetical protein [Tanacetum cinerariifolium]
MKAVIKCSNTREMWNDLIVSHEGPSEGEKVKETYTLLKILLNELENKDVKIPQAKDNDSDVEEDTKSSSEFLANLNAEFHDKSLLANQKRFYKRSRRVSAGRKPLDKSNETCFACGKLGLKHLWLLLNAEDEPSVGKTDARSGQWVEITMKQEPLPILSKLSRAKPIGTSNDVIPPADLI